MENNNETKSSNKIYLVIIGFLVVVIVAVVAFFLLSKKDDGVSDNSNSNSNSSTQSNSNTNVEEKKLVTDADYVISYKNDHKSNEISTEGEQIKVPTVQFNTPDAEKVNAEIKATYLEFEKSIQESLKCKDSDEEIPCGLFSIGYKTYSTDTTISIVVLLQMSATAPPVPNYLVYNFDKETGKLLTIDDLLTKVGMTKEALIEKTMKDINTIAISENYKESGMNQKMDEMRAFINKNIDLNKTKITDGDGVAYFFDEAGALTVVTTLSCPDIQNGTLIMIVPNSAS